MSWTMKLVLSYIIFTLLLNVDLQAQLRFDNYKHLEEGIGMPRLRTSEFAEDKYGFIWMATRDGLARYDGSVIRKFEKIESDSTYLPSQHTVSLLARGDSLWVGGLKGLSIINLETRKIINHELKAEHFEIAEDASERTLLQDIIEDRQGNVWLAPAYGGFVKWEKSSQQFIEYPLYPDDSIPDVYTLSDQTSVEAIIQDIHQDSILWGICRAGILKLNTSTGEIKRIPYEHGDEIEKFNVNRKICIYQHKNGLIYTGSVFAGLSIYDPVSQEYYIDSKKHPQYFPEDLQKRHLFEIVPGESGYLYLTYFGGLYRYNITDHSYRTIKKSSTKGKTVDFGYRFKDSGGRIWNNSVNGINMADPVVHQFKWSSLAKLNPTDIAFWPQGIIEDFHPGYLSLVGHYSDGLYHINTNSGQVFKNTATHHLQQKNSFNGRGGIRLNDSELLISEEQTLHIFNKNKNEWRPYEIQIPIQYGYFRDHLLDSYGTIWFGTRNDGLYSLDLNSKKIKDYKSQVSSQMVARLFEDSKGNVWMTIRSGHLVFNRKKEGLDVFEYAADSASTIKVGASYCECPNGEVWLAGKEQGLGLLSSDYPEKGVIEKKLIRDQTGKVLRIDRIACNEQNELWAMGTGGLLKIFRDGWTAQVFNSDYGIAEWSGMFQFLKSGELFIASRDGFYTIDPKILYSNPVIPKPYVVSVVSNNGPKGKLEDHLNSIPINLLADENVITIEFSAINHTLAERTKYMYMLEGIDPDWIDPGNRRSLTYSYLSGGDYTFKLKAANNEGVWSEAIYKLPLHVGTPWYKTTLFGLLALGLFMGLGYAYYRERIRQIRKEANLKSGFEKRVANLEMDALRAQMNPHFIFNCLNSIDSYIIKNDSKKASEYLNNFSRLVRLILQNSRSTYVNLSDELEALDLYLQLEQMRFRNKFAYEFLLKDLSTPENYVIPPMLIQPFIENSIWHGLNHKENGGKVTIEIQKIGESIQCIIEDNGIGREAAAKIKKEQKIKRKSMGMDITNERIDIINKTYNTNNQVKIEDLYDHQKNPTGTKVTLIIPI